jgi:hypothetical protein
MKHPEMKPYDFTITGTVYAGSESHAMHFVYFATHDGGIDHYRDASAAGIYNWEHEARERKENV